MAGYIGSKSSVTQVDGYSEAEADAEFVNDPNGAITVDGSNVGIGTSTIDNKVNIQESALAGRGASNGNTSMTLEHATDTGIQFFSSGQTQLRFGDASSTGAGSIIYEHSTDKLRLNTGSLITFEDGGIERMRIDSSGNLLVGTTTATLYNATSGTGLSYRNGIALDIARENSGAGQPLINLNLTGADGDHLLFYKDGTTVGSIGVVGDSIIFGRGDTALAFNNGLDAVYPINTNGGPRDNAIDLGRSNVRFDDIYATNGTIQTSDFNEKQDIASLTATEMLVGARISALFKTFRWKDSVAENGDNARTHTGVIAQDVQAAFTAEGLDAGDYALFISSTWWETQTEVPAVEAVEAVDEVVDEDGNVTTEAVEAVEAVDAYTRTDTYETEAEAPEGATSKTRMGIRYPELLSFVAAYNEQRFASIEARLTALEA